MTKNRFEKYLAIVIWLNVLLTILNYIFWDHNNEVALLSWTIFWTSAGSYIATYVVKD